MRVRFAVILHGFLVACGGTGSADRPASTAGNTSSVAQGPAQASLQRLFSSPQAQAEWFAPTFLQAVSVEKVQSLLEAIRQKLGDYQNVSGAGEDYVATFATGTVVVHAKVDQQGRFLGLFLGPPHKM